MVLHHSLFDTDSIRTGDRLAAAISLETLADTAEVGISPRQAGNPLSGRGNL
jgi:hypothetical protein